MDIYGVDPGLADMFTGDVVLDHFARKYWELASIDDDIEVPAIEKKWMITEWNYIFNSEVKDHNLDGYDDLLYHDGDGYTLLDPVSGMKNWEVYTGGYTTGNGYENRDITGDDVDEMFVKSETRYMAIDLVKGEAVFDQDLNGWHFHRTVGDDLLYAPYDYSIKKFDVPADEILWDTCIDPNVPDTFEDYLFLVTGKTAEQMDDYPLWYHQARYESPFWINGFMFEDLGGFGEDVIVFSFMNLNEEQNLV